MKTAEKEWKGYSLEEIRLRRMVALAKIEIQRDTMAKQVKSATSLQGWGGPIMSKLTGALNYVDYAILAFRVGKTLIRLLKKR